MMFLTSGDEFFKGTQKLMASLLHNFQVFVVPGVGVLLIAWFAFKMYTSEPNEQPMYKKNIRVVIICMIIIELVTPFVAYFLSFYGISIS